ncbi:MAG: Ig-like domain-containing protein, partial [Gemmatimonadota bacterium]
MSRATGGASDGDVRGRIAASRSARALALLAVLGAGGCDLFGPDVGPPSQLDLNTIPSEMVVGETVDLTVTVADDEDRDVTGATVTWTASAGTVTPPSGETDGEGTATAEWTLGTEIGLQSVAVQVGDLEDEFAVTAVPDALDRMVVSPSDTMLESVGDTVVLRVVGSDRFGNETLTPDLAYTSSAPDVATVSAGELVSRGEGVAEITVRSGSVETGMTVTVDQVLVGIALEPGAPIMAVGESLELVTTPVDARGSAIDTTLSVSWTSSDDAVAPVSGSGVVDALAVGTATITATAGEFTGSADVDVRQGPRPSITGISPATLAAGDTAVITGTDFATDPALVQVTIAGVEADVLTAAADELTVTVPGPGSFPCAPTGDRDVAVVVDGLAAVRSHPVAGAQQHTLAPGESVVMLGGDAACSELSEPGDYVLAVSNAAPSAASTSSFMLRGTGAETASVEALAFRPRIQPALAPAVAEPDPELQGHRKMMDANRRLVERLGPPVRDRRIAPTAAQEVGDVRTFRITDIEGDLCEDYSEVTARAVYSGTYGVIWEDTVAPLAGEMNDTWQELGTEYDQVMHRILLDYFGDPLVIDDQLDANGLFFMLFSEDVNEFDSPAVNGFVFSGDFYTRSQCPASNEGEIFYGIVPTTPGTGYDEGQVGDWAWRMRSTIIHEVKHVTSYANKFDVQGDLPQPNFEESGLEEATARLAEEFYGRALQGYGQFDNVGYDASIYCELRVGPNWPECDPVPLIMGKHYSGINTYLKSPETLSPLGPIDDQDASFYGSGWQLVRWAIDQSGVPEATFIKSLVREPELSGIANLADKAGRPIPELLADYALAVATDDRPGTVPDRAEQT